MRKRLRKESGIFEFELGARQLSFRDRKRNTVFYYKGICKV